LLFGSSSIGNYSLSLISGSAKWPILNVTTMNRYYWFANLTPSTQYTIYIAAANQQLQGLPSFITTSTYAPLSIPPADVQNLLVNSTTMNSITITWSAPINSGSSATSSYIIGIVGSTSYVLSPSVLSYTFTSLFHSTTYTIQIAATNQQLQGTFVNVTASTVTPPPSQPSSVTNLAVWKFDSTSISVSWGLPAVIGASSISNYTLMIQQQQDLYPYLNVTTTNLNYTFDNLQVSTTYNIYVSACNSQSLSGPISTVVAYTSAPPPKAPWKVIGLKVNSATSNSLSIVWNAPLDNGTSPLQSYTIQLFNDISLITPLQVYVVTTTWYTFTALKPLTIYVISVAASNAQLQSAYVNITTTTLASTPVAPSVVQNLKVIQFNDTSIQISYNTPASQGSSSISNYTISIGLAGNSAFWKRSTTELIYTFTSLSPSTAYTIWVAAWNQQLLGPSSMISATTANPPLTPPSAPRNLVLTSCSASVLTLCWIDPSTSGSSYITGYIVELYKTNDTTILQSAVSLDYCYTFAGLKAASSYTIQVSANNMQLQGPYNSLIASTTDSGFITAPSTVLGLMLTSGTNTSLSFTWSPPQQNGSYPIISYVLQIYRNGTTAASQINTTAADTLSFTFTSLWSSTTYKIQVAAINQKLQGPFTTLYVDTLSDSAAAITSLPLAPTLKTINITKTSVAFWFVNNGLSGSVFMNYKLERKVISSAYDTSGSTWKQIYIGLSSTFIDTTIYSSSVYSYRLNICSFVGCTASTALIITTSGCLNSCSGNGQCQKDGTCICQPGYLSNDCSISETSNYCSKGNAFCVSMAVNIQTGVINLRMAAQTDGWFGLCLNPGSDGMTNSDCWVGGVNTLTNASVIWDKHSIGLGTPTKDIYGDLSIVYAYHYQGVSVMEVQRALDTGHPEEDVVFKLTSTSTSSKMVSLSLSLLSMMNKDASVTDPISGSTITCTYSSCTIPVSWAVGRDTSLAFAKHLPTDLGRLTMNFYSGTVATADTPNSIKDNAYLLGYACLILFITFITSFTVVKHSYLIQYIRHRRVELFATLFRHYMPNLKNLCDIKYQMITSYLYEYVYFILYVIAIIITCAVQYGKYANMNKVPWILFGHIVQFHVFILFALIYKNSLWSFTLGISHDQLVKYHKIISRITFVFMMVHIFGMISDFKASLYTTMIENQKNMYGIISACSFLMIALTSLRPIRIKYYNFFYYAHLVFNIVALIFLYLHAPSTSFWLLISLIPYALDQSIKLYYVIRYRLYKNLHINDIEVLGKTLTKLTIGCDGFSGKAGQFVYINIPKISLFEWHPFSISSITEDGFTLHILKQKGWTMKLYEYAEQISSSNKESNSSGTSKLINSEFVIRMHGPYGHQQIDYHQYDHIVLASGGVGSTPMICLLQTLIDEIDKNILKCKKIYFIWIVKDSSAISEWYPEIFEKINNGAYANLVVPMIYCTQAQHHDSNNPTAGDTNSSIEMSTISTNQEKKQKTFEINKTLVHIGRPDLSELFQYIYQQSSENRSQSLDMNRFSVGVYSCGPMDLMYTIDKLSYKYKFHLHQENFAL